MQNMPNKIIVNTRFLTQPITGVQRFALELCNRLPNRLEGKRIVFVCPKLLKSNKEKINFKVSEIGKFEGNLWEQIDLPFYLKRNGNPLLINLVGIGPVFYSNKITTLHDLAFKHFPEWFSWSFQKSYNLMIPKSLRHSRHIVTVSEYVKLDIHKTYNINLSKIKVIHNATSNKFKNLNLIRENIILTVSSIEPRKNLSRIITAFKSLDTDYKLIIVGKKNSSFADTELGEIKDSNIVFTGYLTDEELINIYNKAKIFIYASLFEGFGIPPLEAQACGCSCIVSRITCLPEIYKDSVTYCDPLDVGSIRVALNNLILDKNKRQELQQKGFKNIERFSWNYSAEKLRNLIEIDMQ